MSAVETRPARRSALRSAVLDLRAISLVAGLRAASACAVPVVVAELIDQPGITWMAVAAFWACLADNGGSLRTRLLAMAGVALLGGVATGGAALIAASAPLWIAVLYAGAVGFAGSFARIFGSVATSVGLLVTTSTMVALGFPPLPPAEVPGFTALYVGGGLWAMLLTLVIWRLHPHQPARNAIAECYRALADLAAGIAEVYHRPHPGHAEWDSLSLSRRRRTREAIETARALLADIRRGRLGESERGEGLILLLESADQTFLGLIGLSELLERASAGAEKAELHRLVESAVERIAPALRGIAAVLSGRALAADVSVEQAVATLDMELGAGGGALADQTVSLLVSLARLVHAAHDIAREVSAGRRLADLLQTAAASGNEAARTALAAGADAPQRLWWDELRSRLRANLTWRSIGFRHAVRLALTAGAAVGVTQAFALDRGYWLTVTAVVILQPYYASTWQRALERVGGSVLGGLVAAGVGLVVTTPLGLALAIFPLAAFASAFRFVNYGLFTFLLTPQFVLISELARPSGAGGLALAAERALSSVAGGALALLAGTLLWPTRERRHLRAHLAASFSAAKDYLGAVLKVASGAAIRPSEVEQCRRRAGLASNNAEGSLDRLLAEPGPRPREAEAAMAVVTGARRLAGAATSLWLMHDLAALAPALPQLPDFAPWVEDSLAMLSEAVAARRDPSPLTPPPEMVPVTDSAAAQHVADTLSRIARQIRILHGAVRRLADHEEEA